MASDDAFYEAVAAEIEGGRIDKALWTKAFSHSGGTEAATKSLYVRYRVEQLVESARSHQRRIVTSYISDIFLALVSSAFVGLLVTYPFTWILGIDNTESNTIVGAVVSVVALPFAFVHFRDIRQRRNASEAANRKC
jgi:hypothetical protein